MKTKHTPGPWVIERGLPFMVVAQHGGMAALLSDRKPTADDMANARLIALAPEMAEALTKCHGEFMAIEFLHKIDCSEALADISAILAKLEG